MNEAACVWPMDRLGDALQELTLRAGGTPRAQALPAPPLLERGDPERLDAWMQDAARTLGVEVEAAQSTCAELDMLLQRAAPAALFVQSVPGVLLLVRGGRRPRVAAPSGE